VGGCEGHLPEKSGPRLVTRVELRETHGKSLLKRILTKAVSESGKLVPPSPTSNDETYNSLVKEFSKYTNTLKRRSRNSIQINWQNFSNDLKKTFVSSWAWLSTENSLLLGHV
jgi:hypothetical protein